MPQLSVPRDVSHPSADDSHHTFFTNRNMLTVTLLKDEAAMLTTLPDAPGYSSAGEKAALGDTSKETI